MAISMNVIILLFCGFPSRIFPPLPKIIYIIKLIMQIFNLYINKLKKFAKNNQIKYDKLL